MTEAMDESVRERLLERVYAGMWIWVSWRRRWV